MSSLTQKEIRQYENLELLAKHVVEGFLIGLHQSPFHGFSVEFAEHRHYNPGESIKEVDWKVYARTDRLFTKKYLEETNLRCHIVLDTSSSMYLPNDKKEFTKLDFSARAAACLMHLLSKQRDAYGLSLFDENIHVHTQAKTSKTHFQLILSYLEKAMNSPTVSKRTSAADALHEIAEKIHRRSLVVIFSDMFDRVEKPLDLLEALQHLKYRKHEVILFHTTYKKKEIDFEFEDRPYEFIDIETGEKLKVNPAEVRKQFNERISSYTKEIKTACLKYKIDYVEADIEKGFDKILTAYLIRRKKMIV